MDRLAHIALSSILLLAGSTALAAPTSSIMGHWLTPDGSVVDVEPCASRVCIRVIQVSASAPSQVDLHNPDPRQRTRPICGVEIGFGFEQVGPGHAENGRLYDPKNGKTYSGAMTAEGNQLNLRGYIGAKLFGRSETWTRTSAIGGCRS